MKQVQEILSSIIQNYWRYSAYWLEFGMLQESAGISWQDSGSAIFKINSCRVRAMSIQEMGLNWDHDRWTGWAFHLKVLWVGLQVVDPSQAITGTSYYGIIFQDKSVHNDLRIRISSNLKFKAGRKKRVRFSIPTPECVLDDSMLMWIKSSRSFWGTKSKRVKWYYKNLDIEYSRRLGFYPCHMRPSMARMGQGRTGNYHKTACQSRWNQRRTVSFT